MLDSLEKYEEQERNYNTICTTTFVKIFTKSQGAKDGIIPIIGFDCKNPEHLFFLSVARGLAGTQGAHIAIDLPAWQRHSLNRKVKIKGAKILPYKEAYKDHSVDVNTVLEELRSWAAEICNMKVEDFSFGDIYYEFYA